VTVIVTVIVIVTDRLNIVSRFALFARQQLMQLFINLQGNELPHTPTSKPHDIF